MILTKNKKEKLIGVCNLNDIFFYHIQYNSRRITIGPFDFKGIREWLPTSEFTDDDYDNDYNYEDDDDED